MSWLRSSVIAAALCAALFLTLSTAHAQVFVRQWGSQGSGPGQFLYPYDVVVDASGNVYVEDQNNYRVQKFNSEGERLGEFGGFGTDPGRFQAMYGMCMTPDGHIWVADPGNNRVTEFDGGGNYLRHIQTPYDTEYGHLAAPMDVAVDASGNIYVVEWDTPRVQKFDASGQFVTSWNKANGHEGVIAIDGYGHVYTCEPGASCVQRWSLDGAPLGGLCDLSPSPWQSSIEPGGLTVDANGNLYVTASSGHYFRSFSPTGQLLGHVGATDGMPGTAPGAFDRPKGIAVAGDGAIYVVDQWNSRVQKFAFPPVPTLPTTWGRLKSLYR